MKSLFSIVPILPLMFWANFTPSDQEVTTPVFARIGSRGANCSGSGICTISDYSAEAPEVAAFKATLGKDAKGELFLEFKYTDLPAEVLATQFGSNALVMQSDCPLSSTLLERIQASNTYQSFKTGSYTLTKSAQAVRINFK